MKAINTKKIVALTTGLAMVGATIFGAAAQDLAGYPSPLFIKDGVFDGSIVVGELAKTSDVIGSIELAAGLQAAAVKKTTVSVGATKSSIDKGTAIDKTGTHLGLGRDLVFVQDTPLDESDFPSLLADGTLDEDEGNTKNKVDYTQEIRLFSGSGQVIFTQKDDDAPTAGVYLFFDDAFNMYNYTLDFDEDVDYDNASSSTVNDDFETAKLDILGKTYTITEIKINTGGSLDKITMLAGDATRWMQQDEPLTLPIGGVEHTFVLVEVNENEDKCGVSVDGTVQWIDVGQTRTIKGVQIGVTDAIIAHSAGKDTDVCEVNLGASELELEAGQEVKLNGVPVDGSDVEITTTGNTWRTLSLIFKAEDDVYLSAGESYIEPIFGAFAFYFEGLTGDKTESIDLTASGTKADLKFMNNDNKEVKLEWKLTDSDVIVLGKGDDIDDLIYLEGQNCDFVTAVTECEGARFLLITSGGEAHLMEINDFDTSDDKITIKDITYGGSSEDDFVDTTLGAQSISLGSGAGTITLSIVNSTGGTGGTADSLDFTEISGNGNIAETSLNDEGGIAVISVNTTGFTSNAVFNLTEESDDGYGANVISFTLAFDSADDDINVNAPTASVGAFHASSVDFDEDDDDHSWYVTNWSTMISYDNEDDKWAKVEYPDEYRYGQAFVGETDAVISGLAGGVQSVEVQQIPVGSAKLDRDIGRVDSGNLIVVGGPCANSVAAELMGNPADCTQGFTEGEGVIKLYSHANGNVAMLAAGYTALDTRRVTRVLANYGDYAANLKGTEVVVKGTTLSDITVQSVA